MLVILLSLPPTFLCEKIKLLFLLSPVNKIKLNQIKLYEINFISTTGLKNMFKVVNLNFLIAFFCETFYRMKTSILIIFADLEEEYNLTHCLIQVIKDVMVLMSFIGVKM